jgi:hypothetical protein
MYVTTHWSVLKRNKGLGPILVERYQKIVGAGRACTYNNGSNVKKRGSTIRVEFIHE